MSSVSFAQRAVASVLAVGLLGLSACAVIDQYGDRAIVYNLQAEQVQLQALLLNIVRASLRRPMQFTGLQTITGTASVSGNVTAGGGKDDNTPYISGFGIIPGSTNSVLSKAVTSSIGGGASMGGGDTFTVPVLDTQEFYQGLLTPISGQLLDLYLQAGYPQDIIYNLTVERLIIKRTDAHCTHFVHTPDCELIVRNYPPNDTELYLFQWLMGYFIRLGLSTEPLAEKPATTGQKSKSSKDESKDEPKRRFKPFVFCFAPKDSSVYRYLKKTVLCGHPGTAAEIGRKALVTGVWMDKKIVDRIYDDIIAPELHRSDAANSGAYGYRFLREFGGKQVSVSFGTRSIEEILYYLGEVTRRSLQSEEGGSAPVQARIGPPQNSFPVERCPFSGSIGGYRCINLFVVRTGATGGGGVAVQYEGNTYSVDANPATSWSMPVLDIVKQLLAVNTSAKDLPASNIISVLSTQ